MGGCPQMPTVVQFVIYKKWERVSPVWLGSYCQRSYGVTDPSGELSPALRLKVI